MERKTFQLGYYVSGHKIQTKSVRVKMIILTKTMRNTTWVDSLWLLEQGASWISITVSNRVSPLGILCGLHYTKWFVSNEVMAVKGASCGCGLCDVCYWHLTWGKNVILPRSLDLCLSIYLIIDSGKKGATTGLKQPHRQNRQLGNIERLLQGGMQVKGGGHGVGQISVQLMGEIGKNWCPKFLQHFL